MLMVFGHRAACVCKENVTASFPNRQHSSYLWDNQPPAEGVDWSPLASLYILKQSLAALSEVHVLAGDACLLSVAFLQGNLAILCQSQRWTGWSQCLSQCDHSCGSVIHELGAFRIGKNVSGTTRLCLVGLGGEGRGKREKEATSHFQNSRIHFAEVL